MDQAMEFCLKGLKLSQELKHNLFEVKFYNALGWLNQQLGDYELSEQNYRKGIALAEREDMKDRLMFFYNNLGNLFEAQSRFDEALASYFKSLDYARALESYKDVVITLNNVGLIYQRIGEYQQGIDYLSQCIKLAEEKEIYSELAYSYTNRGFCLNELKKFEEAKRNFLDAEKQCTERQDCDDQTLADIYYGLLSSEYAMGNYDQARGYFNVGFKNVTRTNSMVSLSLYYNFKSKLLIHENMFDSAIVALDKSDAYARKLNSRLRLVNNLDLYSEIHEKMGDVKKALMYKKLYIQSKDSIFSSSLKDNLNRIQLQEAQKEKQAIIDRQQEKIEQRNQVILLIGITLSLAFFIVVLLYKLNRASNRSKNELEEIVSKRTAEVKFSNRKLRQANKDYETFIYRTYHDLNGPLATIIGLAKVGIMEHEIKLVHEHLNKIAITTSKLNITLDLLISINELKSREIVHQVVKLADIIDETHTQLEAINPLVKFRMDIVDPEAGTIVSDKMLCSTLITELVKNALFHTKQDPEEIIQVILRTSKHGVELEISNNGIAIPESIGNRVFDIFTVASEKHGVGIGLYLAQIAAGRIGAELSIKKFSSPVTFLVRFPHRKD